MKDIYVISGLGADERLFNKINFTGFNTIFIKWIAPQKNESIESYAKRLSENIKTKRPIIIGLSFGGIMAIEIAKQIEVQKIILLASVKTKTELPFYYQMTGKLNIHKLIPIWFFKKPSFITNWLFGINTKFEKNLIQQILSETNSNFFEWAIDKIVCWKNETIIKNLVHIHGNKDRLFPIRYIKCDIVIADGGHFMTLNKSEELTEKMREQLGNIN